VVTNQRGVALGRMTDGDVHRVHERLSELLAAQSGGHIDGYFYCPHDLDSCSCRKPGVGLFLQATERWPDIDLGASAMVGDSPADVLAGEALGMRAIRLGPHVADLAAAVDALLG
jgi:D-glycero-D-manno-heptose 1,7-bisphosphate phosphatase